MIDKKQVLKRRGNHILRMRWMNHGNIHYRWYYSKELYDILKKYGKIEDWQLFELRGIMNCYDYEFNPFAITHMFGFRNLFKATQEAIIKELLQYSNKVGKYANR